MSVQAINVYWGFLSGLKVLGVVNGPYLPVFRALLPEWECEAYPGAEHGDPIGQLQALSLIDFRSDEFSKILYEKISAEQKWHFDFSGVRRIVHRDPQGHIEFHETLKIKDLAHEVGTEVSAWKMDAELLIAYIHSRHPDHGDVKDGVRSRSIRVAAGKGAWRLGAKETRLLIFPCGTTDAKKWPQENWLALLESLKEGGHPIEVFLGPSEKNYIPVFDGVAKINIDQPWDEIIQSFDENCLVLANDCGPMHVAGTMGQRLIALFGPTNEKVWFTYQETGLALKKPDSQWPSVAEVRSAIAAFDGRQAAEAGGSFSGA